MLNLHPKIQQQKKPRSFEIKKKIMDLLIHSLVTDFHHVFAIKIQKQKSNIWKGKVR